MKRRVIILTTILILIIVGVTVIFSYAYFSAKISNSNTAIVNTQLPSGSYTFTTTNTGEISYTFNADKMQASASSIDAIASDNANLIVSLKSPDTNTVVVCTYDLVWEWTGTDQYTTSDTTLPLTNDGITYNFEMSVKGTSTTSGNPTNLGSTGATLSETDLSKFEWSGTSGSIGYKTTIVSGATIASNSPTATETKWDLTSSMYNIPVVQTKLQNKNFKAKISVSNIDCNINEKLPSGYTQKTYLQSSGTQYINTGFKPNQDTRVITKYKGENKNFCLFGGRNAWQDSHYSYWPKVDNTITRDVYGGSQDTYRKDIINLNVNDVVLVDKNKNNTLIKYDEKTLRNNFIYHSFQSDYTMFIFGCNNGGSVMSANIGGTIYYFKLYNNGTLIRNYIPSVRNSDSKSGFYDTVNNEFYTNVLSNSFIIG